MFSIFRIVPQREKNFTCRRKRVIKVCDFLPHLPFILPRALPIPLSLSLCLVCVRAKLLRSFVNCFRATRTGKPTHEWMKRRRRTKKSGRQQGAKTFRERVGGRDKLTFSPLASGPRKKETSGSRSPLRILQAQVYTSELWPEKSEVRGRKVAAECLACDAHNKVAGMRLGETFAGTRK